MNTVNRIERQLAGLAIAGLPTEGATAYVTAAMKADILDEFNSVRVEASSVTTMLADVTEIRTNDGRVRIVVDAERAADGVLVVGPEEG